MKSQISTMLRVMTEGVFNDAQRSIVGLRLDRDIQAFARIVKTRGLGFFTLDLPSLDSVLTDGLESGRLVLGSSLTRAVSAKVLVPRLLSGLWLRVFDSNGVLRCDACVDSIFFLRQIFCFYKKLNIPCSPSRNELAIKEYVHVDQSLRQPTFQWKAAYGSDLDPRDDISVFDLVDDSVSTELPLGDRTLYNSRDFTLLRRFQRLADQFSKSIGTYFPACYTHVRRTGSKSHGATGLRHGPGAVSKKRAAEKYAFPNWSPTLNAAFPYKLMVHSIGEAEPTRICDPSRLIAVPKTAKAPRLIAAEPVENQFCQQLTWRFLEEKIKGSPLRRFINFRRQDLSKELVASCSKDQLLCTVDLSSASDRLSLWVVERVFRKNFSLITALHAHRSKHIELPSGELMWLKKFASQGAAVTFPIQTIIFTLAALSACGVEELENSDNLEGKVRVFGDDMIVPTNHYDDLVTLLHLLQLKVNLSKSFAKGYFRESCGADYFKGYCVTPLKPQSLDVTTVDGRVALLDVTNNLWIKGLWCTSEVLRSLLPVRMLKSLPVNDLPSSSPRLFSFSGYDYNHLRKRWNVGLSRLEYKSYVVRVDSRSSEEKYLSDGLGLRAFFNERSDPALSKGYGSSQARSRTRDTSGWATYDLSSVKLGDRRVEG